MNPVLGHDRAAEALQSAAASGALHHAWLLAGPRGVGKAAFARASAMRLLADAAGEAGDRTRALMEAGSHPDFKLLTRDLKPDAKKKRAREEEESDPLDADLARNITVDQVRSLLPLFATTPSLSPRRVVIIDAIDDCEREASNALLKGLEEPPAGTVFLLVSHAPGRLLPTIRSRCRLLRFEPLGDAAMRQVIGAELPDVKAAELEALIAAGEGSPGKALGYAGLKLAALDAALEAIAAHGDRDNARRLRLAQELSLKAAQPRYMAFLERAPRLIARHATARSGAALRSALETYEQARELAAAGRWLSADAYAPAVFELAGVVARLATP